MVEFLETTYPVGEYEWMLDIFETTFPVGEDV